MTLPSSSGKTNCSGLGGQISFQRASAAASVKSPDPDRALAMSQRGVGLRARDRFRRSAARRPPPPGRFGIAPLCPVRSAPNAPPPADRHNATRRRPTLASVPIVRLSGPDPSRHPDEIRGFFGSGSSVAGESDRGVLLVLRLDARERLADSLFLFGNLVQCSHSVPSSAE